MFTVLFENMILKDQEETEETNTESYFLRNTGTVTDCS